MQAVIIYLSGVQLTHAVLEKRLLYRCSCCCQRPKQRGIH